VVFFLSASIFLFRAHFELSPNSKYAPHFLISQNGIKTKTGVFKKSEFINWDEIIKMEIGYHLLGIKTTSSLNYHSCHTRKETSIQIKKTIEAVAVEKGIEVENLLEK